MDGLCRTIELCAIGVSGVTTTDGVLEESRVKLDIVMYIFKCGCDLPEGTRVACHFQFKLFLLWATGNNNIFGS